MGGGHEIGPIGASNSSFYYASIRLLSLGAPFWYSFLILVMLSLSLLRMYYDACTTLREAGTNGERIHMSDLSYNLLFF